MELRDLNADEKVALAALLEFVVLASGTVTEDEEREIDALVEELGEDTYRKAMEEVDRRFQDEESVKTFLKTITRQEARDLIYGTVIEAAMTDRVEGHESKMLEWVANEWKVQVTYEEPPADDSP
jgi:aminopeptidase N